MAPLSQNYDNAAMIARTELELRRKAEAKHQVYVPLPHDSKRWRMIAGNVMMGMLGDFDEGGMKGSKGLNGLKGYRIKG